MEIHNRIIEKARIRATDVESRTVEFIASDNSVDSYDTVLPVDKWDLNRYAKNPIVGYQHDIYGGGDNDPDNIIGKGVAFVDDAKLIIRVTFEPKEINEKAEKIFQKVMFGTLNGVSVGFAPTAAGHFGDKDKGEDPKVYYFNGQELLEVSVVNIPANANAVRRSIDEMRKLLPQRECDPENDNKKGIDDPEEEKPLEKKKKREDEEDKPQETEPIKDGCGDGEDDESKRENPDDDGEEEKPLSKKKKREDDKPEDDKEPFIDEEPKPSDEDDDPDKNPQSGDYSYSLTSARAHLAIITSKQL